MHNTRSVPRKGLAVRMAAVTTGLLVLAGCATTVTGSALPPEGSTAVEPSTMTIPEPPTSTPDTPDTETSGTPTSGTPTATDLTPPTSEPEPTTEPPDPTEGTVITDPATSTTIDPDLLPDYGLYLDHPELDEETKAGLVEFARLMIEEDGVGIGDACAAFGKQAFDRAWADPANRATALGYLRDPDAFDGADGAIRWYTDAPGALEGSYYDVAAPCLLLLADQQAPMDPVGCLDPETAAVTLNDDTVDERWTYCFTGGYLAVGGQEAGTEDASDRVALLLEDPDGVVKKVSDPRTEYSEEDLADLALPGDAVDWMLDDTTWKSLNESVTG